LFKKAEAVVAGKRGQFISYSLNTTVFDEMIKWVMDVINSKNT